MCVGLFVSHFPLCFTIIFIFAQEYFVNWMGKLLSFAVCVFHSQMDFVYFNISIFEIFIPFFKQQNSLCICLIFQIFFFHNLITLHFTWAVFLDCRTLKMAILFLSNITKFLTFHQWIWTFWSPFALMDESHHIYFGHTRTKTAHNFINEHSLFNHSWFCTLSYQFKILIHRHSHTCMRDLITHFLIRISQIIQFFLPHSQLWHKNAL